MSESKEIELDISPESPELNLISKGIRDEMIFLMS